ncbi:Acetyltransferase (GNAT) family protein [Actinacidiphila alni]|uniref:Acetyltransferase (GNAT) family protein n=1 Tax=Actinacidiphila alni TaxID=380248 RepID=A0A1I2AKN1_9ACTN|nr:GNAT family N-acetyltransferase [Actinacidiphila alni]SFE43513.1 Acetyltransferase (GNAT) family protein [Actinacidiphila alni]
MDSFEATRATQGRALRALARTLGAASPGATTYDSDGVTACIVPAAKNDADANFAAYTAPAALASALPEIAEAYETAGVGSWEIYVPESDDQTARGLAAAGYRRRDRLPAIILDLATFEPRSIGDLDYDVRGDVATLGRLNAAAYDRPELARAFAQTPDVPGLRVYRARLDGEPACALLTIDVPHADGLDCAAYFLATVPNARRRGLAPRLFTAALLDARERGCDTCSGQASPMGAPIYARMGFRTAFHFDRYEKG